MAVQIQLRRGTASQWTTADPVLAEGEMGLEIDTGKFKVGNGTDAWSALTYSSGPAGATGPQGPQGIQGIQGETGAALTLQGTYATTAALFAAHPTGSAGEGWIVEADGDLYVWDVDAAEWVSVGQIVGPPGPANTLTIGTITTGAAGSSASGTITGTAPNQTLNLTVPRGDTGLTGSQGLQGYSVLSGSSNPTSGDGVNGDWWINTSSLTIFGPKSAGAWPGSGTSLVAALSSVAPAALGTASAGSANSASRGDHVHAMPTAAQVGALSTSDLSSSTPSALGSASAGTGVTVSRADHVHAMPSAANVSAIPTSALTSTNPANLGSVAPGTSNDVARRDHVHAMPLASDVGAIASTLVDAKGDLLTATADNTPARLAVGTTNGHVLKVNSLTTTGLEWGAVDGLPSQTSNANRLLTTNGTTASWTNLLTNLIQLSPEERFNVVASAATGTININFLTAGVWFYTTNASANHTINFRGDASNTLSSLLATGDAITVGWIINNGTTAYYPTTIQIDGSSVTPKWLNGASLPTASQANQTAGIDAFTFTIIKTAATPTYTVLGSWAQYR